MEKMFKPALKLITFTVILFSLNVLLILQLIPIFESQTLGAKIVNLVVFPANFLFEDLTSLSSTAINFTILPSGPAFSYRLGFIDLLTWVLQFVYDYIIVYIIMKGGNKNEKS
jgi:hypothetical protein